MGESISNEEFEELKEKFKFHSINKDLVLVDDILQLPKSDTPVKRDASITLTCIRGKIDVGINLKRYTFEAPCFVMIRTGNISQFFNASEDFQGNCIAMSSRFLKDLEFSSQQTLPLFLYFENNPSVPLNEEDLKMLKYCYQVLRYVINKNDNVYRLQVAKHLIQAFYYALDMIFQRHMSPNKKVQTRQEAVLEEFVNNVQKHYREERGLEFYAKQMCLTSKYLSLVIKRISGRSANEWIDDHVILEAKVLLKTTKMTIQQISDELHFADQSGFGRYFKRHVGMSPKKFREIQGGSVNED